MDNLFKMGTPDEIITLLESELRLNRDDAEKMLGFLLRTYRDNTVEFGCITPPDSQMQGLVLNEGQYYINLPRAFLVVIAFLLDMTLTSGIVSTVGGMLGLSTQVFYNMNQDKGEVCLLREYMRDKRLLSPGDFHYLMNHECVNNDIACVHRNGDGTCCLSAADIESTVQRFREAGIIQ